MYNYFLIFLFLIFCFKNYTTIIWHLIKIYTYGELTIIKIYNYLENNYFLKDKLNLDIVNYDKYFKVIKGVEYEITHNYLLTTKFEYDMILHIYKDETDIEYITRIENPSKYNNKFNKINLSKIELINPIIKLDNEHFKLKIKYINYMIIDNKIFDNIFLEWFLNKYYNYKLKELDNYEIIFLDIKNLCKITKLNKESHIIVKDNNYIMK